MRTLNLVMLFLFAALFGACTGTPAQTLTAPPPAAAAASFKLSPGDKLRITTFGEPTLTGEFTVSSEGTIAFPLIGEVKAGGIDASAIQKDITARLSDGYLLDPKVNVDVIGVRPVYVLGEVNKPGEYPFTQGLTVRGAVAKADGFTYRANTKRVFLRRAGETAERPFDLREDFTIQPGDTIRIGERYF